SRPRNAVLPNAARIDACANSGLLQRRLKCASTTVVRPRCAHAAATAPAARLLRWPNGPAIRSHTLGGYGPARSHPSSWLDSRMSVSSPESASTSERVACPTSYATPRRSPDSRAVATSATGSAASCAIRIVRTDIVRRSSVAPLTNDVPVRGRRSERHVPALAYVCQRHFVAHEAAARA